MTSLELLFIGSLISVLLMTASWAFASRRDFYSLVDVVWAYGIGLVSLFYSIFAQGDSTRRILVAALALGWSLRLGTYLGLRLKEKYPEEDRRYLKIKESWKGAIKRRFFWFFQFQAISQPVLSLPFLLACTNHEPLQGADLAALIISLLGILGESLADFQLRSFKHDIKSKGRVCDFGLWRYSRHPNYFFEWVIWCGFALFGISAPHGYLGLISPALMYFLLNFVTGVPPAEEQSLLSKGDLFRDYQKRTSRFFPWIPGPKRQG